MRVGIDIQSVARGSRSGLYSHIRWLAYYLRPLVDGQLWLLADATHPRLTRADAEATSRALDGAAVTFVRRPPKFYRVWHWASRVNRLDVLLHNLHGYLPLCTRGANGFVVPDVIPLAFDYGVPGFVDMYRPFYEAAVRHGDVIIVWSEHAKNDFLARVGGSAEKVRVAPLAAPPEYHPIHDREEVRTVLSTYGLADTPYVLCVSSVEKRKNHSVLIRAFSRLLAKDPNLPHRLVLVGGKWIGHEAVFGLISELGLSDRVTYLGFAVQLPMIYAGADAFVFPSLYEGFGLPPLEAMACGIPVLAANATSLPEVVGDAGVLFDPHDPDTLADCLHRVLVDRAYRDDLASRGLAQAKRFSWRRTAELYLDAFRSARQTRSGVRQ